MWDEQRKLSLDEWYNKANIFLGLIEMNWIVCLVRTIYYALINRECGPYAKNLLWHHAVRTKRNELYCIPTQVKPQKVSVFLCYYGLALSQSNFSILSVFVWYTITVHIRFDLERYFAKYCKLALQWFIRQYILAIRYCVVLYCIVFWKKIGTGPISSQESNWYFALETRLSKKILPWSETFEIKACSEQKNFKIRGLYWIFGSEKSTLIGSKYVNVCLTFWGSKVPLPGV